jgi:predicted nucleic acid-binding protein
MKKKVVILDSSVWLSYLFDEDSNFLEAEKIISNIGFATVVLIPEIILLEVLVVLHRTNRVELLNISIVNLSVFEVFKMLNQYKGFYSCKTSDLLIIFNVLFYECDEFYTFDKQQLLNFNKLKYEKEKKASY